MNMQDLTEYFLKYGAFFIYLIVFLEYLNLPGFPAGVIMPLSGIWAARGEISFPLVMLITLAAGLTGSWLLYFLGRLGGPKVMGFYFRKFPKHREAVEEKMEYLRKKGSIGVFISKLIPVARTLISIPAGMIKMDFRRIYHQFRRRSIPVESRLCRRRILLWRTSDHIFYTRRDLNRKQQAEWKACTGRENALQSWRKDNKMNCQKNQRKGDGPFSKGVCPL